MRTTTAPAAPLPPLRLTERGEKVLMTLFVLVLFPVAAVVWWHGPQHRCDQALNGGTAAAVAEHCYGVPPTVPVASRTWS